MRGRRRRRITLMMCAVRRRRATGRLLLRWLLSRLWWHRSLWGIHASCLLLLLLEVCVAVAIPIPITLAVALFSLPFPLSLTVPLFSFALPFPFTFPLPFPFSVYPMNLLRRWIRAAKWIASGSYRHRAILLLAAIDHLWLTRTLPLPLSLPLSLRHRWRLNTHALRRRSWCGIHSPARILMRRVIHLSPRFAANGCCHANANPMRRFSLRRCGSCGRWPSGCGRQAGRVRVGSCR